MEDWRYWLAITGAAESDLIEIGSGHLASSQYDATAIVALFDTYT